MAKFKKRRVRLIDNETASAIITDVRVTNYGETYEVKEKSDDCVVVEVKLTDCYHLITWHEFGDTKQEALDKADEVISAMLALKADIKVAYDHRIVAEIEIPEVKNDG